mmetsp:Transcript_55868/g.81681  ORF Transcript_55868/g.81681 Transcript_55868/m.81681 type:complete len:217 (+) Transcript_55868:192-842(+)
MGTPSCSRTSVLTWAECCISASASVSATMASTMGTARGSTQGSWRPFPRCSTSVPSRVTVFWSWPMVDVGLNATFTTMVSPLLIPPWMPPLRLVRVRVRPLASRWNSSLCSLPVSSVPPNPEPTSNPLAAGSDMQALASSASSLSNTGAPRPAGTLRAATSTTPPMLFPDLRTSSMRATMRSAAAASGHRAMLASTSARVTASASTVASMSCTRLT